MFERGRCWIGALVLVASGCGPQRAEMYEKDGAGGGASTDGETATSTTAPAVPTPEAWLGYYHWTRHLDFGDVVTTPVPARFPSLEIRDDGTCVFEMMHCADADEPEWTRTFECEMHDDHVRLHNYEGSGIYNADVVAIDFVFGPECGELTEYHLTAGGAYGFMELSWMRGRACVVDPCELAAREDPLLRSEWTYDLCPGEPTDCPCLVDTHDSCPTHD
jgi:hypothetical protein